MSNSIIYCNISGKTSASDGAHMVTCESPRTKKYTILIVRASQLLALPTVLVLCNKNLHQDLLGMAIWSLDHLLNIDFSSS